MIVGIIGNGFVGKATFQLKCKDIDILAYDINPASCVPQGLVLADMNKCELVFISVPTPMSKNGSCHLNIIESVLRDLASIDYKGFIVLRSTVPVGTCDKLNCYFMPEFLTEKNFINDFINNKDWMFGLLGKPEDEQMKEKISELFSLAHANDRIKYNNLHFITNKEAEMIKMFKNCYLATKVSFCNEIYQFCEQKQVNYEVVRALATADERILPSHTRVPGHDGQKGFGGTCFPKDTSSLRYEMQQANMTPYILNAIIERNELVDRPQKDWLLDKGRAAVDE
jgi:UDPglucose 6-dehydrogenase